MAMESFDKDAVIVSINEELRSAIAQSGLERTLHGAVSYAVLGGGKRIRPLLALALAYDLSGKWQPLLPAAIAIELLHCASLVHDDLPALDNDDYRRGRLACHKQFGEATALLAGDSLMPLAVRSILDSSFTESQKLLMIGELSQAFCDLCSGQQRDLLPASERGDPLEIYALKTGALFRAAFFFGSVAADLDADGLRVASEFGSQLGIFFQIIDDYLDFSGMEGEKGRPGNSDARNAKLTLFEGLTPVQAEELLHRQEQLLSEREKNFSLTVAKQSSFNIDERNNLPQTNLILASLRKAILDRA